jgi:hypothetical protein
LLSYVAINKNKLGNFSIMLNFITRNW